MTAEEFVDLIGAEFYCGVPDSHLRALCDYLMERFEINPKHHIIAANEGNCVALAAGYHLASGKVPVVYMQNSGEGNIINPLVSLLHEKVYAIPVLFLVGWRGEPGILDEPQHIFQGKITLKLLEDLEVSTFVLSKDTTPDEVKAVMAQFKELFSHGKSAAFLIRKDAVTYSHKVMYQNKNNLNREEVIRHIIAASGEAPVISTTGKISRELFETRVYNGQSHKYDFLTVGSMGHSSSIALGIAANLPVKKVWCIDGDGAVLMHMGALAVLGVNAPHNLIHIIINNEAHESVGGMPTVGGGVNLTGVARACGYPCAVCVDSYEELDKELEAAEKRDCLCLIEVKCALGSRKDLGRPTTSALENKINFMEYLKTLSLSH